MLAKSKLDSIEILVSQALIDMEISHEELGENKLWEIERKSEESQWAQIRWKIKKYETE